MTFLFNFFNTFAGTPAFIELDGIYLRKKPLLFPLFNNHLPEGKKMIKESNYNIPAKMQMNDKAC